MYESSKIYKRTEAERKDQRLSWNRPDKAFFAAGACHILAYAFYDLHRDEGYQIIGLIGDKGHANHLYASNGQWTFDFNGWTPETELLRLRVTATKNRITITDNLEDFCKHHYHRPPAYFLKLPWERAYAYMDKFPATPPRENAQ